MSRYLEDLEPVAIAEGDYPYNCTWLGEVKAGDKLYSAATVERLVQEQQGDRSEIEHMKRSIEVLRERLAAMTEKRDAAVNILEQTLVGISFGELRKAYAAYRAGEKYDTVVDRIEALLAANLQERVRLQHTINEYESGDKVSRHYACPNCAAMTQERETLSVALEYEAAQLAASQAREQRLRKALEHISHGNDEGQAVIAILALFLPQDDTVPQDDTALR